MNTFSGLWQSMRPSQWVKNVLLFAALIFAKHLFDFGYVSRALIAFGLFCLLSGAVYIFNDLRDVAKDRYHPQKSQRPIAAGRVSTSAAVWFALLLIALGIGGSFVFLDQNFAWLTAFYVLLNLVYSTWLKGLVILDVMVLAVFYVLRAVAGAVAIAVVFSPWLILCTFLLALFLGFGKRRHELTLLTDGAGQHRPILNEYSAQFLDQMIAIVTALTVVAYIFYTVSDDVIRHFGTTNLVYTVPFVIYGIFRYLYLIHLKQRGGSPSQVVISDRPLMISNVLWLITVAIIIYG